MKAKLTPSPGKQTVLTLTPESDDESVSLLAFAEQTARVNMISCRGFQYLAKEVGFLIQSMSRGD